MFIYITWYPSIKEKLEGFNTHFDAFLVNSFLSRTLILQSDTCKWTLVFVQSPSYTQGFNSTVRYNFWQTWFSLVFFYQIQPKKLCFQIDLRTGGFYFLRNNSLIQKYHPGQLIDIVLKIVIKATYIILHFYTLKEYH